MGSICTNQPIQLPDYKETVSGTTLPGFVAAGGLALKLFALVGSFL